LLPTRRDDDQRPWFFGTLNSVKGLNYGVVKIPVNTRAKTWSPDRWGGLDCPEDQPHHREGCLRTAQLHGAAIVDAALATAAGDIRPSRRLSDLAENG